MGSSGQLYSLSWGEFSSSLTSAVQVLRGHGDLVDVTLSAGGKNFSAHRLVLSAASPFLLEILKDTPCRHPIVMLAGIDPDDLESILEFVYHGQVSVEPSKLPSLLQTANCLSIHGLSPPTIITDDGEQVPIATVIPETELYEEPITKINQVNNNQLNTNKRKKRRKSLSTSKWQRVDDCTNIDNEEIITITNSKEQNNDEVVNEDETNEQNWTINQSSTTNENSQQEQIIDLNKHLHTLLPLPQYSPLHIPSFPNSLNIGMLQTTTTTTTIIPPPTTTTTTTILPSSSLSLPVVQGTSGFNISTNLITSNNTPMTMAAAAAAAAKIRGASDCPGQCSFCGATLRQARNLRRHILSSCKYRFNNQLTQQNSTDEIVVEIKPEIDVSGFMGQSYMTDSGGSNSCEQIVYKTTTPLSSPNDSTSDINSSNRNGHSPNDTR